MLPIFLNAQGAYAPAAGEVGTTAIHKDSNAFVGWGEQVAVARGYKDILNQNQGLVNFGSDLDATGVADGQAVSLGDSGVATITFEFPIIDGLGPDFAVFENGFSATFLELAFVEVSSDGVNFFRFPAQFTLDANQIGSFGTSDPTHIHNLAGKYQVNYGTPFDLADIPDNLLLDKSNISHVRIVDVIGNIGNHQQYDSEGRAINDPYPTAFDQGGFDLDAVGVINSSMQTSLDTYKATNILVYPNPTSDYLRVKAAGLKSVEIIDLSGKTVVFSSTKEIELSNIPKGVYFAKINTDNGSFTKRIIKN